MSPQTPKHTPDFRWFERFLLDQILPRWLERAVTDEGLFLPNLDRQWRRKDPPAASAVSQSRLLYNFAVAFDLTRDPRYHRALESGARFLADKFRDPVHGGWFHAVGPGGTPLDDHKNAYDFAFIIFGLSHAHRVTADPAFRAAALDAWDLLNAKFRDPHGGYVRRMTRDFRPNEDRRSQNPIMHLFEALLAAHDASILPLDDARQVGEFVLTQLLRPEPTRCIPEFYTTGWAELPESAGGRIDAGHQFEWAYLLSSAVERGLPAEWLGVARDLLDFAVRFGLDPRDGGIVSDVASDGRVIRADKGWWQQCEAIRALMHHAVLRGRRDLAAPLDRAVAFARANYVDAEYGGWLSTLDLPPTADSPDKGGLFKVDYHVVGMCAEAIRLARNLPVR